MTPSNRTMIVTGLLSAFSIAIHAAPVTYEIDPNHTYPAFETDHLGGLSVWRGKFTKTSGKIVYDASAHSGSLDVTIDTASIDLGNEKLEAHVRADDILDAAQFPTATFSGKLTKFHGSNPTEVAGQLTLHGVTRPVTLVITQFLCKQNPLTKKEVCGADAMATINRKDFGVGYGEQMGFRMQTQLLVSIEAIRSQ